MQFFHRASKSLFVAAVVFASQSSFSAPCQGDVGKDFVSANLQQSGLNIEPLVELLGAFDQQQNDIRSLLILKDCKLVLERYKEGVTREHNHAIYSVTKSLMSTLVGVLEHKGKLKSVDVKINEVLDKSWRLSDEDWARLSPITLRNVLNMASGYSYTHNVSPTPVPEIYLTATDRLVYSLKQPTFAEPGKRFNYSDADASIAGAVVAKLADQNVYDFAKDSLFKPLKMTGHDWEFRDSAWRYPGGWGARLRPMDMAKLGQLYLQKGQWNGQTIFQPEYVSKAWGKGVSPWYGLFWWIGNPSASEGIAFFYADGHKGQRIIVFPENDVVVVMTATLPGGENAMVFRSMTQSIAKSLKQTPTAGVNSVDRLQALEKQGFKGVTRTSLQAQDTPR
jgi:CubicO group peptidase (beta-lactamase class C family)